MGGVPSSRNLLTIGRTIGMVQAVLRKSQETSLKGETPRFVNSVGRVPDC